MREKNMLQILKDSRYTVVLSGAGLMVESGYPLLRDGKESYEIEENTARSKLNGPYFFIQKLQKVNKNQLCFVE